MSTPLHDDYAARLGSLETRLQALTQSLARQSQRVDRKRATLLAVGVALMVLCGVSFWTLTSMAFQLDAEALARIGRHKVETGLPAGRERMHEYLVAKAPEFTSYAIGAIMSCVPSVRPYVLNELDTQFSQLTAECESRLLERLNESFAVCKAELDAQYPHMSDAQKVDALVTAVTERFTQNVQSLYHEIYPDYAAQISRVENYLVGLKESDATQLSPRDKAEKEMIQTLLTLIAREQQGK